MTADEIIKAIKYCSSGDTTASCVGCPIDVKDCLECNEDVAELSNYLVKNIVDLINRQKAENERLKAEAECADGYANALVEKTKTEAIKGYVERLKERKYQSSDWSHGVHPYVVEEDDIDDVFKETVGSNDD